MEGRLLLVEVALGSTVVHQHRDLDIIATVQCALDGVHQISFSLTLANVEGGNENAVIGIGCVLQ